MLTEKIYGSKGIHQTKDSIKTHYRSTEKLRTSREITQIEESLSIEDLNT
jgi:hypothetical protein